MIRHPQSRNGFSLLEVILALGLTVVVISAIFSAMRLYMYQLEHRRSEIERKQISRGVIRMISDDLRAAIQYKAEDYSGLENLIASQSLSGIGGLATGVDGENVDADQLEQQILDAVGAGGGAQQDGVGGDGADGQSGADGEEASEEEEEPDLGRPTLIGGSSFIRIDTSRLPRLDEYNPLIARRGSEDRLPADIKAITYFFSNERPSQQNELDQEFGTKGGLYRRQIDRAVESFISGDDDVEIVIQPDDYCDLIAPELSVVQFRYWDGEEWQAEWDSAEAGGFPSAIEIRIVLDPERLIDQAESLSDVDRIDVELVRSVVYLPVAEIEVDDSGEEAR